MINSIVVIGYRLSVAKVCLAASQVVLFAHRIVPLVAAINRYADPFPLSPLFCCAHASSSPLCAAHDLVHPIDP